MSVVLDKLLDSNLKEVLVTETFSRVRMSQNLVTADDWTLSELIVALNEEVARKEKMEHRGCDRLFALVKRLNDYECEKITFEVKKSEKSFV